MVGGAPGLGGGPTQPPTQYETETQAYNEVTKKYVLGMVWDSIKEAIPFTQQEYDEVFQYKAEAERPTLHPLLHLRGSELESLTIDDETWKPAFQELFEALPETIQGWLKFEMEKPLEERDPSFVSVHNVLTAAAKALSWLNAVTQPVQPNTSAERSYLLNVALPFVALRGMTAQTETVLNTAQGWLDAVGANYIYHDALTSILSQLKTSADKLERLREEVESGHIDAEVRQRFVEAAYELDRLQKEYTLTAGEKDLSILGAHLKALATVSAAWALTSGSPSLLLAASIATSGLRDDMSAAGIVGGSYVSVTDALVEGLFQSILSGPRAELEELTDLHNTLAEWS